MIRKLLAKGKAILGTSAIGAGLGALLGAIVPGVVALLSPSLSSVSTVAVGAAAMGLFGAFTAGGFATLLALGSDDRELSDLSIPLSGLLGVLAGAVFPTVAALLTGGWIFPLAVVDLAWAGLFFGVLGGGLAAGLVSVAKHESAQALPAPSEILQLDVNDPG